MNVHKSAFAAFCCQLIQPNSESTNNQVIPRMLCMEDELPLSVHKN